MNTLSLALSSACQWLKARPDLRANPGILVQFVSAHVEADKPTTEEGAIQCGINAVRECAGCVTGAEIRELLEPEDLRD